MGVAGEDGATWEKACMVLGKPCCSGMLFLAACVREGGNVLYCALHDWVHANGGEVSLSSQMWDWQHGPRPGSTQQLQNTQYNSCDEDSRVWVGNCLATWDQTIGPSTSRDATRCATRTKHGDAHLSWCTS